MKTCLEGTDNLVKRGGDAELLGLAGLDPSRGDLYAQKQVPVCLAPTRSHSRKRDTSLHNQTSTLAGTGFAKKKGEKNGHNCETWKKRRIKKARDVKREGGRTEDYNATHMPKEPERHNSHGFVRRTTRG